MLSREQRREIQKAGEAAARHVLTEAWSKEGTAAIEFSAYGVMDITGRVLEANFGSAIARQLFLDMADRLGPPPAREG